MMEIIDQINDQLNRLGVSAKQDTYLGLEAEFSRLQESQVYLYDGENEIDGEYHSYELLDLLKSINVDSVELIGGFRTNIWNAISECKAD